VSTVPMVLLKKYKVSRSSTILASRASLERLASRNTLKQEKQKEKRLAYCRLEATVLVCGNGQTKETLVRQQCKYEFVRLACRSGFSLSESFDWTIACRISCEFNRKPALDDRRL
jgi:hypothetical protein